MVHLTARLVDYRRRLPGRLLATAAVWSDLTLFFSRLQLQHNQSGADELHVDVPKAFGSRNMAVVGIAEACAGGSYHHYAAHKVNSHVRAVLTVRSYSGICSRVESPAACTKRQNVTTMSRTTRQYSKPPWKQCLHTGPSDLCAYADALWSRSIT